MGNLTVLAMQEPVQVDVRRLGEIVNELGESAAQTIICAAMEQLAAALAGAREAALDEAKDAAKAMGANGIVGIDFDYEVLGEANGMMLVSVTGTAVKMA